MSTYAVTMETQSIYHCFFYCFNNQKLSVIEEDSTTGVSIRLTESKPLS